jgi:TPR repeat protein
VAGAILDLLPFLALTRYNHVGIGCRTMSDAATILAAVDTPSPLTASLSSAAPARCLRCAADLSRLPEEGRYCPRCGLDTFSSPPAALQARAAEPSSPRASDALEWKHLGELTIFSKAAIPPTIAPSPESSSQIVRGYASALYKLGRRYEVAAGTRNPREAIRCYLKAARLGNMMAFARLATRWIDRCDRAPKEGTATPPEEQQPV